MLANGSILVGKQLADVIVDLDQVRHSMGQRGRKAANQVKDYRERWIWLTCSVSNILFCREIILIELMLFSTVLVRKLSNLVLTSYDVLPTEKKVGTVGALAG